MTVSLNRKKKMQLPKATEFPLGKLEIDLREILFTYIKSYTKTIFTVASTGENLKTLACSIIR